MLKFIGLFIILFSTGFYSVCQNADIITGADQPEKYMPLIANKKVGLVVNHTSMVKNVHLVDFLLGENVNIEKILAPEHGFRGEAANGEEIEDGVDRKTGVKIASLYGSNRKPSPEQMENIEIMIFDVQDVGCRFYTYISTLHYVIEACAENDIPLLVFDRPNPNGDYIAGPVLKKEFSSFVGMDEIPIVHGCTVGELAQMINGEKWIEVDKSCDLKVIPVLNYTHSTLYECPVLPSPNLPNYLSVRLYPSLCFFEATSVSVGRGTEFPFQVLGGLNPELGNFQFTPKSIPGFSLNPVNEGKVCYGIDFREMEEIPTFTLKYFLEFYNKYNDKSEFLTRERWFNLLAGTDELLKQIKSGKTEEEILSGLKPELDKYNSIRKKYLLYPDFEK